MKVIEKQMQNRFIACESTALLIVINININCL